VSWIVARTEPSREQTARRFLELGGFSVYIPVIREQPPKKGHRIERLRPLFPSYAFVAFENGRWWNVRWCTGVSAVIMSGDGPAQLSDHIVDELKIREVRGVFEPLKSRPKLGSQIRVCEGPLAGQLALSVRYALMNGFWC
jgi:transcription antitermination factor NusG